MKIKRKVITCSLNKNSYYKLSFIINCQVFHYLFLYLILSRKESIDILTSPATNTWLLTR